MHKPYQYHSRATLFLQSSFQFPPIHPASRAIVNAAAAIPVWAVATNLAGTENMVAMVSCNLIAQMFGGVMLQRHQKTAGAYNFGQRRDDGLNRSEMCFVESQRTFVVGIERGSRAWHMPRSSASQSWLRVAGSTFSTLELDCFDHAIVPSPTCTATTHASALSNMIMYSVVCRV